MKETIIYGGAFCPPTRAHQAILQSCIDYAEPRQADVWLLPSANRQDKTIAETRDRRLAYCDALARDVMTRTVSVGVNTTELDRDKPTETYDTVRELADYYPQRHFTWVFGSDSVATMRSWSHGQELFDELPMLVVKRPGVPEVEIGRHALWLPVETAEMSSTELRRRMGAGEDYAPLVGYHVGALLAGTMV